MNLQAIPAYGQHGQRVRAFHCQCGRSIFFRNSTCLACQAALGYDPIVARLFSLAPGPGPDTWVTPQVDGPSYLRCANLYTAAACNWLLLQSDGLKHENLCRACRLNRTIPDLEDPQHPDNGALWGRIELAKRRVVSALLVMGLPVDPRETKHGLMFDFLRSRVGQPPVMSGHDNGVITLNITEADSVYRESTRKAMQERYRTLVGHLRHEVGHYYWDRLVQGSPWQDEFRELFGDERSDYAQSLNAYYMSGPLANWSSGYVSSYATAHPWEDWAESWAHYMHMHDTVDTALSFGLSVDSSQLEFTPFTGNVLHRPNDPGAENFLAFLNHWTQLTVLLNGMSRAMGQPDIYPFVLPHQVVAKLHFIHLLVAATSADCAVN